jgi:hypothetical protein
MTRVKSKRPRFTGPPDEPEQANEAWQENAGWNRR